MTCRQGNVIEGERIRKSHGSSPCGNDAGRLGLRPDRPGENSIFLIDSGPAAKRAVISTKRVEFSRKIGAAKNPSGR
jgi:hypothetical protein